MQNTNTNSNTKKIILVGGGGHCKAVIDVIEEEGKYEIAGIIDIKERLGEKVLGYEVIGTDEDIKDLAKKFSYFLITIGQIKSPDKRVELYNKVKAYKGIFPTIISPRSYVSKHATIEEGTIIMHNAYVGPGVKIGKNCIINTSSVIEHDVEIGDHCHISTGAIINGRAKIEEKVFIGSNAIIRENIIIPKGTVIAGGGRVLRQINSPNVYRDII